MEKKISKKFSILIYAVFLGAGIVAALVTERLLFLPMIFLAPSVFFVFYTVLSERKREWDVFFGILEAFGFWFVILACKFANFF